MKTIHWGIIGAGDVCEKKSGPAFYKIENSALSAIMRRDEAKAKDFARRHAVPKYYIDAKELINDPGIDAIYVATPPHLHKEYAIMAMEAGKPVYVEKPMAMDYAECEMMNKVSEQTNQKLFVAFYRRALPYFIKVKSLIDEQYIGKILTVTVTHHVEAKESDLNRENHTWRVDKKIAGEGYFYDLAPHTLDILDFLLGEIESARGYSRNMGGYYDAKDTISAIFKFKSGVLGTGQWCFVASGHSVQDTIEIKGTKGIITFGTFDFSPIEIESDEKTGSYNFFRPEHIQQPLIQTIVDELRGVGQCPSTGISGARTSRVMDMILADLS